MESKKSVIYIRLNFIVKTESQNAPSLCPESRVLVRIHAFEITWHMFKLNSSTVCIQVVLETFVFVRAKCNLHKLKTIFLFNF